MKGHSSWNYTPYHSFEALSENERKPYISRLEPKENGVCGDWLDNFSNGKHSIFWSKRTEEKWQSKEICGGSFEIDGLEKGSEYEIYIESDMGEKSNVRLFIAAGYDGKCVDYLHVDDRQYAFSGNYPCSPSMCRVPSGAIVASCDIFGGAGQNLQKIFRSEDNGKTWHYVTDLFPSYWGQLFCHKGKLYMLSLSKEYGDIQIGVSEDEGKTWSKPSVIRRGGCLTSHIGGWHRAPMQVRCDFGRLWTGVEFGSWAYGMKDTKAKFWAMLFSVDENADLLVPENWSITEPTFPEDNKFGFGGIIEGNAVCGYDGKMYDLMRYINGTAILYEADKNNPERKLEFRQYVDFPMAHTKFETFKYKGKYLAVGNLPPLRTQIALMTSENLIDWKQEKILLDVSQLDMQLNAHQYPAAFIEGETLYLLTRSSLNGAHSFHDANYILFHKFDISDVK